MDTQGYTHINGKTVKAKLIIKLQYNTEISVRLPKTLQLLMHELQQLKHNKSLPSFSHPQKITLCINISDI